MLRSALALSCGTRLPAPQQPSYGRPTHQPTVSPAKESAPTPNSARGGRRKTPSRGRLALSPAWWRTIIKKCKTQNEFVPNTSVAAVRTSVAHGEWVVWWANGLVDGSVVGWVVGSFCTWVSASAPVGGKLSFSSMPACSGDAYEPTHMFAAVPGSVVTHGAG